MVSNNSYMINQPYIVTGDSGFVGKRLRDRLLASGESVIGIHRREGSPMHASHYRSLIVDLADRESLLQHAEVFRSARAVIHLAGHVPKTRDEPLDLHLAANLRTTENLLCVMDRAGVPLVLCSTMYVYGLAPDGLPVGEDQLPRPTTPYGISKLAAEYAVERMARADRVRAVAQRCPVIFGVGSDVAIHLYASKALSGEPVSVYGSGTIIRDYVHVDDVVDVCLQAAQKARSVGWGLYHIGGGAALTMLDFAKLTIDAVGGGSLETSPPRPGPHDFAFDISRARSELGYAPIALKDRIAQYVEDVRRARNEIWRSEC